MDATRFIARKRTICDRPVPIFRFLRAYPMRTLWAALTGLAVGILGWAMALLIQHVVDHTRDIGQLTGLALVTAVVLAFRGGLSLIRRSLQVELARRVEGGLVDQYLDHVTRLDLRFYEKYHTGDLLDRLRGVEVLRNALEDRFLGVTFDATLVFIAATIMIRYNLALALLATVGAIIPAILIVILRNSIRHSFEDIRHLEGDLANQCMDSLQGIRDMRMNEAEDWILHRIKTSYRNFQDFRIRHIMKLTLLSAATLLISALTAMGVLVLGARLVASGQLSQGQMMFLYTMGGTMLGPLEQLAATWISFDEASVAFSRYNEILHLPAEPRRPQSSRGTLRGHIVLDRVTFGYRSDRIILNEVSLQVEAGSSIAIVGESGAGKSTLLSLLCGLYQPDRGRLLLDGKDIRDIGLQMARSKIGVVFQSPHLFSGTIEENIKMGRADATREDIEHAAVLAHADDFIRKLPQGYQSLVSLSGANFSGGQVQRIAIARALLGSPSILLLDEATGNLDAHTEAAIWATLTESELACTRVFITHRLSTTCQTDRIVVMDHGRIAEDGRFEQLMRSRGLFYRLWNRQIPSRAIPGASA
jgi:ABC-type bacteriocin/lantibiotic exporter with double-glycine peptidase domain